MGYPAEKQSYQRSSFVEVSNLLRAAVEERIFPGGVCCIAKENNVVFTDTVGHLSYNPFGEHLKCSPVRPDTVYDVDSLTSSLITTTLIMKAVEEQRIQLSDRVSRYLHGFGVFGKSPIRVIDLLLHQSGLPGSENFYQQLGSLQKELPFGTPVGRGTAQHLYTLLNRTEVRSAPRSQQHYSEVGTLALGHLIEELWAKRIDRLADEFIFQPLEIRKSGFINHSLVRQGKIALDSALVAPSEECAWRKRVLQGEIRDENTWAIGGASGEAGLFATAEDVTVLIQNLMYAYHGCNESFLAAKIVRYFLSGSFEGIDKTKGESSWKLGWATSRAAFGVESPLAYEKSLGVVSPTGCAVWMDPQTCTSIVFLSNRTMPLRSNRKIVTWWPKFLQSAWKDLS